MGAGGQVHRADEHSQREVHGDPRRSGATGFITIKREGCLAEIFREQLLLFFRERRAHKPHNTRKSGLVDFHRAEKASATTTLPCPLARCRLKRRKRPRATDIVAWVSPPAPQ